MPQRRIINPSSNQDSLVRTTNAVSTTLNHDQQFDLEVDPISIPKLISKQKPKPQAKAKRKAAQGSDSSSDESGLEKWAKKRPRGPGGVFLSAHTQKTVKVSANRVDNGVAQSKGKDGRQASENEMSPTSLSAVPMHFSKSFSSSNFAFSHQERANTSAFPSSTRDENIFNSPQIREPCNDTGQSTPLHSTGMRGFNVFMGTGIHC